ncbi:hypothetical protein BGZ61DRAFT_416094 [Ilyonectria robusta]|uniref:uncharacterized protein n=1 Tax=Ilyonectria robusta TaxID=1079257 RepID=UPI001E8CBFBC|nr:uncharacterized protein BGZ61DRAFT_416094 [Ilyonectria robusta]KAH8721764.1 hypothetical protein BGZ61DRAFT_416094 [Ilyonectria robusta]
MSTTWALGISRKRACDSCYRRKIQCDSTDSGAPCNWCHHHGDTCTFTRHRKKPKTRNKFKTAQSLSQRLEHIDNALVQVATHQDTEDPSAAPKTPRPTPPVAIPGSQTGINDLLSQCADSHHITEFSGLIIPGGCPYTCNPSSQLEHVGSEASIPTPFECDPKWLRSKIADKAALYSMQQRPVYEPNLSPSRLFTSLGTLNDLPSKASVKQALNTFSASAIGLVFPLVDPVLFEGTITKAFEPCDGTPSMDRTSARACVLAFLSAMHFLQAHAGVLPSVDGHMCAAKVFHALSDVLEDVSIVTLQTILMLHIHQTFSGRLKSALRLHSIACRLVIVLGGHMHQPTKSRTAEPTLADRENHQLRMLFWQCYIFDKQIMIRTHQPPLIPDDYCDLTPPGNNHLPCDTYLSHIKSKAYRLLYSEQARQKSDAELLCAIRELDADLEEWRSSIPLDLRPALSLINKSSVRLPKLMALVMMRHVFLCFEYHHLVILIHQASRRCRPLHFEPGMGCKYSPSVQSSATIALEASRSTVIYLDAALHKLESGTFWLLSFYLRTATKVLFVNILSDPLKPQAKSDLDLMRSAAILIRNMPGYSASNNEADSMESVDSFVDELIRLGNCAILKGAQERNQLI